MPTTSPKGCEEALGHGQEDIFPVNQFEKLWVDMSGTAGSGFALRGSPRLRGQSSKIRLSFDGCCANG